MRPKISINNQRIKVKMKKKEIIYAYMFIAPAVFVIIGFLIAPIIYAFILSFVDISLIQNTVNFRGLEYYYRIFNAPNGETFERFKEIMSASSGGLGSQIINFIKAIFSLIIKDDKYLIALVNTIKYVIIVVPIQTLLALVLASVLNSGIRAQKTFRIVYFLPTLTSSSALTLIFMWIFNQQGLLNIFLAGFGFEAKRWLSDVNLIMPVIMTMNIWSTAPFFMTIYLAGLQDIPKTQYEAAKIDGANAFQRFWFITVPNIQSITNFVVLIGAIGCFQIFDQAFIISNGSGKPANSTLTVVLLIYQYAFKFNQIGMACAMSLVLAVIIMIFSLIARQISKDKDLY